MKIIVNILRVIGYRPNGDKLCFKCGVVMEIYRIESSFYALNSFHFQHVVLLGLVLSVSRQWSPHILEGSLVPSRQLLETPLTFFKKLQFIMVFPLFNEENSLSIQNKTKKFPLKEQ